MSGIAGIFNIDGAPVDRALLQRMTDAIAHRGPDGIHHWVDGPVGIGHCMLQTTPESVYERQPLTDESGHLCLNMDGRVDNREELISALKSKNARLRDDTDAELVLKAYECWGEECPVRILGDFAFVIWDMRQRQLFCARDILGVRPFYYYTDGRKFLWASELQQLFRDPGVPREPNEGMVAEYLAASLTDREETLYKGIMRLAPAHSLLLRAGRIDKRWYWDVDPSKEVRHRTDEEYAEHFSEVFAEAVRCRLRSQEPVGAELSGGLDSSAVVGMAQRLYQEGRATDLGFVTFSLVYPGLACDESAYIDDVVRMWGVKSNRVRYEAPEPSA
jgi:asparagine synthase (glutamine-hydrolysing)